MMRTGQDELDMGVTPGRQVEVALTEHAEIANPEKPLVEALVWGSIAQDRSSRRTRSARSC